jgi:hypothetical protein
MARRTAEPKPNGARDLTEQPQEIAHTGKSAEQESHPSLRAGATDTKAGSPIEALGLSVRARNKLHQLGCHSIGSLVGEQFARMRGRLGPATRDEIAACLARNGFTPPGDLVASRGTGIAELVRALGRMRERIEVDHRRWRAKLDRLEQRIRRLSE